MSNASPSNRRTFAIISHPDAGKTTLTEKLLLQGGAIHLAGEVKARGAARRARSDWMKIEQQRGISVTSSVMTFERANPDGSVITFNLLDTPGHEDFSEDTYRTLTAVDAAIMVIDAAKGIEPQTRKLFEVCRLRSVPIITFVNKVDREGRSVFETLDEVADALALDVVPMSWPVGMGGVFQGVLNFADNMIARPEGDSREFLGKRELATADNIPADIAEEIELAKRYLAIEQVRFGERLQIQWQLDPGVHHALLPPLLLQPLVENAIRHGVEPSAGGGKLQVRTARRGEHALVQIVNTLPEHAPPTPGHGMALANVRARLSLLHDMEASISAKAQGGHFIVRLHVPLPLGSVHAHPDR